MKCDYEVFKKLLSWKTEGKYCIEVNFAVDGSEKYCDCWLGKTPSPDIPGTDAYWYGLVADGSEEYDFTSSEDMLSSKGFRRQKPYRNMGGRIVSRDRRL